MKINDRKHVGTDAKLRWGWSKLTKRHCLHKNKEAFGISCVDLSKRWVLIRKCLLGKYINRVLINQKPKAAHALNISHFPTTISEWHEILWGCFHYCNLTRNARLYLFSYLIMIINGVKTLINQLGNDNIYYHHYYISLLYPNQKFDQ